MARMLVFLLVLLVCGCTVINQPIRGDRQGRGVVPAAPVAVAAPVAAVCPAPFLIHVDKRDRPP